MLKVAINTFKAINSCGCINISRAGQLLHLRGVRLNSQVSIQRTVSVGAMLAPFSIASKGHWTQVIASTVCMEVRMYCTGREGKPYA